MAETRIVVGSGPNGVGVAHALLEQGFHVTMLDIGRRIEPEIAAVVARMARQEPDEWSKSDQALVRRMAFATDSAPSPKLSFGSSYAYAVDDRISPAQGITLYGSEAFGGLSNVWGCALLRCTRADLTSLPHDVVEGVIAAYPRVEDLVARSMGADSFASLTASPNVPMAPEAQALLRRHCRGAYGSQIDVYPTPLAISGDCKACNGCMYGCVYGYTYTTRKTVEKLFLTSSRFTYVPNMTVTRYAETQSGVEVHAFDRTIGKERVYSARQLFLAAGMMGSLRIVWNSNRAVSRSLEASDSTCFILPGVRMSLKRAAHSRHHGQSHLSVDIRTEPFEDKPVHCQLYFNNPAVADGLVSKYSVLRSPWLGWCVDRANEYLVAAQGYVHSEFCHKLLLESDADGRIRVSVRHNPRNADTVALALSSIAKMMRGLGIAFLPKLADVTPFGGSKTAGALPHSMNAVPHTTDLLGRPFGCHSVFVVDATVLGVAPGRNMTLTTMANAYRIGLHAPQRSGQGL